MADPVKFLCRLCDHGWGLRSLFRPRNETTKYALAAPNLICSGQVSKDYRDHKVMASVFWDREGVLVIDYLKQGNNVTSVLYAGLVRKLFEAVKEKWQVRLTHGSCFTATMHQRTPPMFPWWLCMNAAANSSLNHLILQMWLHRISKGPVFIAVIMATYEQMEEQDHNFLCEAVKTLQQRWKKIWWSLKELRSKIVHFLCVYSLLID